ncbi:MAG: phosphatase PAP2 family protein [Myxococcota bacterium]
MVYFAAGLRPVEGRSLGGALDAAIPFHPLAVVVYGSAYPLLLGPLFLVRDPDLFRRTWLGYAVCILVCGACFVLWPVGSADLRVPLDTVSTQTYLGWGIHLLYALDPPRNCFPSLHLALATTGSLAVARTGRAVGAAAFAWLAALALCVLMVKQHYVIDAVTGIGLGLAAAAAFLRDWRPAQGSASGAASTGAAGALALLGFVGFAFAALFALYAAGVAPPAPIW